MTFCQKEISDLSSLENQDFLTTQLITYIGNKRALLPFIEKAILETKKMLRKEQVNFLDLFSGSGAVSRLARRHSSRLHCNDLELYSHIMNSCYQTNQQDIDIRLLEQEIERTRSAIQDDFTPGFITELYAPNDDENIQPGERVFFTRRNAIFLDSFCRVTTTLTDRLRPYLLAPILSQASMHTNTSGVFKGFYKNRAGIGQFGGTGKHALSRIKKNIDVQLPIFSRFCCDVSLYQRDANALLKDLEPLDIAYFDPPYNQHPYGSNYFMLNLLCDYQRPKEVSRVSGIPINWNRSLYNKAHSAAETLFDAIENVDSKFVLISYNSEGFVHHDRFLSELMKLGNLRVMDTRYNTFRGCRHLSGRDVHVTEFLYLLDKR